MLTRLAIHREISIPRVDQQEADDQQSCGAISGGRRGQRLDPSAEPWIVRQRRPSFRIRPEVRRATDCAAGQGMFAGGL